MAVPSVCKCYNNDQTNLHMISLVYDTHIFTLQINFLKSTRIKLIKSSLYGADNNNIPYNDSRSVRVHKQNHEQIFHKFDHYV